MQGGYGVEECWCGVVMKCKGESVEVDGCWRKRKREGKRKRREKGKREERIRCTGREY